jgi:hypothetical protein
LRLAQINLALGHQFCTQLLPLIAQCQGACQGSIAADDYQTGDTQAVQVERRLLAPFTRAKIGRPGGSQHRAALLQDAAGRAPPQRADLIPAIDSALPAFVDSKDSGAPAQPTAHHGAHGCIHARRVAAAGQHTYLDCCHRCLLKDT